MLKFFFSVVMTTEEAEEEKYKETKEANWLALAKMFTFLFMLSDNQPRAIQNYVNKIHL